MGSFRTDRIQSREVDEQVLRLVRASSPTQSLMDEGEGMWVKEQRLMIWDE